MLKRGCQADGLLDWLHTLVLMEGSTVLLLATIREGMTNKVTILKTFCSDDGMVVKTKLIVIGG